MRRKVVKLLFIVLLSVFGGSSAWSQEGGLTVSFQETPMQEAMLQLENLSGKSFYFHDQWFGDSTVSASFTNKSLSEILDSLFQNTEFNHYLLDNSQLIILRNNIIYDVLPDGFFQKDSIVEVPVETIVSRSQPVFNATDKRREELPIPTLRIGKDDPNSNRSSFILTGTLTDEKGSPAADVTLFVKALGAGTTTDKSGKYRIELPKGNNLIETRSLTYANLKKRVIIYNDGNLDFELPENLEELETVFLEGSARKNVEDATAGVTKIDVKEIKTIPLVLGERDVLKVATTLPGITTAGEGSAGYNVRGGKEDQNLILLDEGVVYNPAHFFGIFSGINPFTTEDVEIYKGNIPAEYGGRLSSVIDISSKDANVEKFAGEGSIGPVTGSLTLEMPLAKGKSGVLLGGRTTYSNWILRSLDDESLQNSEASFYDVIVKFNQEINEKNDLKATGYYSRDAFSITSDSLFNYSNRMVSVQWDHKINDNNRASAILTNSRYQFGIEFDGESNTDFDLNYDISETGLKVRFNSVLNESHSLDYGIATKYYVSNPGEIDPINGSSIASLEIQQEKALESALFISDEFNVSDKLLLSAGFRFSIFTALGSREQNVYVEGLPKNEDSLVEVRSFGNNEAIETYTGPEFRLAARYLLMPDLSIKASFNSTYQFVHTLTNNTTISPIDTWKLSDLNIEPQRANQVSLGLYQNLKDNDYQLSLEGYYKRAQNILDFKTGASILLNENIETEVIQGEGKSYGIEFLARKTKGRLNGWLGYTYSRSFIKMDSEFSEETINNGEFFPSNFDKPHDFSLVANYKMTKRFSFSANFVYQTGRPVTVPVGNFVINNSEFVLYSDRNAFRIPDYYRLDLSFNVEGNHKIKKLAHSFWNISVYNVLGRNNPYSVFFVNEAGEIKALQSSIFAIPVPTITYNFKF